MGQTPPAAAAAPPAPKRSFADLPLWQIQLPGYLRPAPAASSVIYRGVSTRFIFHDLDKCHKPLRGQLRNPNSNINRELQQQLAQLVDELQCLELDANYNPPPGCVVGEPQLSWRDNVRLKQVQATGPGSRAFNRNSEQQQLTAVVPTRNLAQHDIVGFYLGYMLDADKYDANTSAADSEMLKYQFEFSVSSSRGAGRVRQSSEQGGRLVTNFIVDASQCLEGNPLAHMLDCRAFKPGPGWVVDEQRSVDPNVDFLAVSDNTTGRVYVAVLTLRPVTVAEDLCIDYTDSFWEGRRYHDSCMQLAAQQHSGQEARHLKQQMQQLADEKARLSTLVTALKGGLSELQLAASEVVLALQQQPGPGKDRVLHLAAAGAAASLVLGEREQAVAAAVAAEVSRQVDAQVASTKDACAAEVRKLQQELQQAQLGEKAAAAAVPQQHAAELLMLQQRLGERDAAISRLEQRAREDAAAARALQQQLKQRDAEVSRLQVQRLQQLLSQQQSAVRAVQQQHGTTVNSLQQQLGEKGAVISSFDQQLRQKNAAARALQRQLERRGTEVSRLQQQRREKDAAAWAAMHRQQQRAREEDAAVDLQQRQHPTTIQQQGQQQQGQQQQGQQGQPPPPHPTTIQQQGQQQQQQRKQEQQQQQREAGEPPAAADSQTDDSESSSSSDADDDDQDDPTYYGRVWSRQQLPRPQLPSDAAALQGWTHYRCHSRFIVKELSLQRKLCEGIAVGTHIQLLVCLHDAAWDPDAHMRGLVEARTGAGGGGAAAGGGGDGPQPGAAAAAAAAAGGGAASAATVFGPFNVVTKMSWDGEVAVLYLRHNGKLTPFDYKLGEPHVMVLQERVGATAFRVHIMPGEASCRPEWLSHARAGYGRGLQVFPGSVTEQTITIKNISIAVEHGVLRCSLSSLLVWSQLPGTTFPCSVTCTVVDPTGDAPASTPEKHTSQLSQDTSRLYYISLPSSLSEYCGRRIEHMSLTAGDTPHLTLHLEPAAAATSPVAPGRNSSSGSHLTPSKRPLGS